MKTPEEYFQEKVVVPEERSDKDLTPSEQAFVQKYLGMGGEQAVAEVPRHDPRSADTVPGFSPPPEGAMPSGEPDEPDLEETLKGEAEIQLVSFQVGEQEFAMPISAIQEVIRHVEPTKLPAAPHFMPGIVNLRGRVTPLVSMRTLLGIADGRDRFIIVCQRKGLQIGLMVTAVKTMYRAPQKKIEWGIETAVGINASFLAGLMKSDAGLVNILSVDRLVRRVLGR